MPRRVLNAASPGSRTSGSGDAGELLDRIGRLFSYTRQLDAVLNDDQAIERYARSFLDGKYELAETGGRGKK